MQRLVMIGLATVFLGGIAAADIRISDDDRPRTPAVTPPPAKDPIAQDKRGCAASREAANPEWLFGIGVLVLGAWGLRRFAPRRTPA